jgi:hypothetical protein
MGRIQTGEPTTEYRPIGDTGLEGCVYRGLVWVRGPCSTQHAMSFAAARQLSDWLGDLGRPTIEGTAVTTQPRLREINDMPDFKPTICIDFDGVIHRYSRGWQGGEIYDGMTDGFVAWALRAKEHFTLVIYSSRSSSMPGRLAMQEWLLRQIGGSGLMLDDFVFAHEKPAAWLTIDDRCIRFEGRWDWLRPEVLLDFKPWYAPKAPG